jgi:hypothetical protein
MAPPRVYRRLAGSALIALVGLFLAVILAGAGRQAGHWGADEFQVQNLWPQSVVVTYTMLNAGGTPVWTGNDVLGPKGTLYLQPPVSPGLSGTLYLDSNGPVVGAVAHLELPPSEIGNEVYEMLDPQQGAPTALLALLVRDMRGAPSASRVIVHNLAPVQVTAGLALLDANGVATTTIPQLIIPPGSVLQWDLAQLGTVLPQAWIGAGRVLANQPVLVEVVRTQGQSYESYVAPADGAFDLAGLVQLPYQPGAVTSTVDLVNFNGSAASVVVVFSRGSPVSLFMPPTSHARVLAPISPGPPMTVRVQSSQPVAAVSYMESGLAGSAGTSTLPAFAYQRLTPFVAVPLLYDNYLGWTHQTPGTVRVFNASAVTATVQLYYYPAGGGAPTVYTFNLAGGGSLDSTPPPGIAQHWALSVISSQPVAAAVMGFRQTSTSDHWFAYRGLAVTPMPTPTGQATASATPTTTSTPPPTRTNTPPPPTRTNTPPPPTATATRTNTPPPTATNTPSPTATNTPSPTTTNTPPPTATNTPSPTATDTPLPTATATATVPSSVARLYAPLMLYNAVTP